MADLSGTITSGGDAQDIAGFNPARRSIYIQNISDTPMWVAFGVDATEASPSIYIPDGEDLTLGEGYRELIVRRISVIGATTGKAFTAFDSGV